MTPLIWDPALSTEHPFLKKCAFFSGQGETLLLMLLCPTFAALFSWMLRRTLTTQMSPALQHFTLQKTFLIIKTNQPQADIHEESKISHKAVGTPWGRMLKTTAVIVLTVSCQWRNRPIQWQYREQPIYCKLQLKQYGFPEKCQSQEELLALTTVLCLQGHCSICITHLR